MKEPAFDDPRVKEQLKILDDWGKDVFVFCAEALNIQPAQPWEGLKGAAIKYKDQWGQTQTTILFDSRGRLVYHDLSFYTKDLFQHFNPGKDRRLTWQQTVILEAYNRAISTFNADSFDMAKRWITTCSGHGIGKTSDMSIIALHFLICFAGSQVGATAASENQLKDIFLKEFYIWKDRLPDGIKNDIKQLDDMVKVGDGKDWFMRARVAKPDKPEALAGLHADYVLILVDEASGIDAMTFQVMKGALTGQNYIVMYFSNPTRTEGEFYESQKKGGRFTKLQFSSLDSPIVRPGYADTIAADYGGTGSDEYRIRVLGQFAGIDEMDDKGWIPLMANLRILFEPENGQIINRPIIGVDPAGMGRDRSIVSVRDNIYLKEVLNEATSGEQDLARKIETIRDAYRSVSNDIGIDAFGIGARVVANIQTKMGESVNALLTDKPRPGTEDRFATFRDELAWKFREWCARGGIVITNNPQAWQRELNGVKFKRDKAGRIHLQSKVEYRKDMGFSPDRFDAALYTFFKDEPAMPVVVRSSDMEMIEQAKLMRESHGMPSMQPGTVPAFTQSTGEGNDPYSSM